ncbi:hypothetical protein C8R43DRAFT_884689 [Mycena crocata]|nr:hypothetical protein C8R43DRAFT_884689 [Mycena crocata]
MGTLVRQETATLPEIPRMTIRESYAQAAENFINAPDALKVCWAICTFNAAVFIACRIPPLSGFMYRNFVHRPLSGKSRTLLTSIFGHGDIFHIVLNSMALLSFGAITGRYLNSQHRQGLSNRLESTTAYHFFAFFVAAGLFSSLASHMLRVKLYDAAIASIKSGKLATNGASDIVRGSLGASGAIYAAVTLTAMAFPNLHVSPIFVPVSVPIQYGVGGMVMLDIIGLLRGWRRFDHVAHLGGAVFGLWYYAYGLRWWDYWRDIAGYMFRDR